MSRRDSSLEAIAGSHEKWTGYISTTTYQNTKRAAARGRSFSATLFPRLRNGLLGLEGQRVCAIISQRSRRVERETQAASEKLPGEFL